jgi:ribonuclease T1
MRSIRAIGLVVISVLAIGCHGPTGLPTAPPVGSEQPLSPVPSLQPTLPAVDPESGLAFVELDQLPREASETVALIESAGPFPYDQDGAVFQNREGILPDQPSGYYHEYTVETPGSPDRGARRIISGADGQLYWTDDHYDSFSRIVP